MTAGGTVTTITDVNVPAIPAGSMVAVGTDTVCAVMAHSIVRMSLDGTVAVVAGNPGQPGYDEGAGIHARFNGPLDLERQGSQLVVADTQNHALRRVDLATFTTSAWVGMAPQSGRVDGVGSAARFVAPGPLAADPEGNTWVLDVAAKTLRKVTPAGVVTTVFTDFPSDGGVAIDAAGNAYGVRSGAIVRVTPAGGQTVFAGQAGVVGFADGTGTNAQFARPLGLAFDSAGNLFVGDAPVTESQGLFSFFVTLRYGNTLRRITPAGVVSTFAGTPGRVIANTIAGSTAAPNDPVNDFHRPTALATDGESNVVVLDTAFNTIRRIAAGGGTPFVMAAGADAGLTALAVQRNGRVFFAQARSSGEGASFATVRRLVGDGTNVVVAGAELPDRLGVALGPLPASLNFVSAMTAWPDGTLVLASENSLLRIQPA